VRATIASEAHCAKIHRMDVRQSALAPPPCRRTASMIKASVIPLPNKDVIRDDATLRMACCKSTSVWLLMAGPPNSGSAPVRAGRCD